jgi:hypothetical protein
MVTVGNNLIHRCVRTLCYEIATVGFAALAMTGFSPSLVDSVPLGVPILLHPIG